MSKIVLILLLSGLITSCSSDSSNVADIDSEPTVVASSDVSSGSSDFFTSRDEAIVVYGDSIQNIKYSLTWYRRVKDKDSLTQLVDSVMSLTHAVDDFSKTYDEGIDLAIINILMGANQLLFGDISRSSEGMSLLIMGINAFDEALERDYKYLAKEFYYESLTEVELDFSENHGYVD